MNIKILSLKGTIAMLFLLGLVISYIVLVSQKNGNFRGNKVLERTLAIIKPDAVKAKNSGKIIDRIEQEGFNIVEMKKLQLTKEQTEKFYAVHKGKAFYDELVEYMSSGPLIVMVLEKENAIKAWRDLMGPTDPAKAPENTLRKLYGTNVGVNATHGSDAPETAKQEIKFFFEKK